MKKKDAATKQTKTSLKQKMRKAKPKKRIVLPDPVFNDVRVSKL